MKKLIINMLLLFGITVAAVAQAYDANPMAHTPVNQPENNGYLNNLSQNGYYNEMYRSYWVWDVRSSSWIKRVELVAPAPYAPATNTGTPYQATNPNNNVLNRNAVTSKATAKRGG